MIEFSDGNRLEDNDIVGIPSNPNLDSDGGVLIRGSANNTIIGGEIRDTGDAGVVMDQGSNDNTRPGRRHVSQRRRRRDRPGLGRHRDRQHRRAPGVGRRRRPLEREQHDVRNSDLRFNPSGVEHNDSNDVTIEGNNASDSLQTGFEIGNGLNIRIIDNIANRTGGAGIGVEGAAFDAITGAPVGGALIQGNTTNENSEVGITVADGGHTVRATRRTTTRATASSPAMRPSPPSPASPPPGRNIDGGGNQAAGNGISVPDPGNPPEPLDPLLRAVHRRRLHDGRRPRRSSATGHRAAADGDHDGARQPDREDCRATFEFTATDNRTPLTAMTFECRLDPLPDPIEPVDPERSRASAPERPA